MKKLHMKGRLLQLINDSKDDGLWDWQVTDLIQKQRASRWPICFPAASLKVLKRKLMMTVTSALAGFFSNSVSTTSAVSACLIPNWPESSQTALQQKGVLYPFNLTRRFHVRILGLSGS